MQGWIEMIKAQQVKSKTMTLLRELSSKYKQEGLILQGVFGSYARGEDDHFSDIDIAYKIDHDKFYKDDAFKKLIRIEEIKKELEKKLKKRVDMVPLNKSNGSLYAEIKKEMIVL